MQSDIEIKRFIEEVVVPFFEKSLGLLEERITDLEEVNADALVAMRDKRAAAEAEAAKKKSREEDEAKMAEAKEKADAAVAAAQKVLEKAEALANKVEHNDDDKEKDEADDSPEFDATATVETNPETGFSEITNVEGTVLNEEPDED